MEANEQLMIGIGKMSTAALHLVLKPFLSSCSLLEKVLATRTNAKIDGG
jgi:hypothetical protein